jgi:hypothetical protein
VTTTSTAAFLFKDAFYSFCTALFQGDPDVTVSYGNPGTRYSNDWVILGELGGDQAPATQSSSLRHRRETLTLDVMFASYKAGELDDDRLPTQRVYELMGLVENYCRTTDTTVGGTVLWCFMTSHKSDGATDDSVLASGRAIQSIATFTAVAEISN